MPEKPKSEGEQRPSKPGRPEPDPKKEPGSSLADDQNKRGYYYDDAYGYEDYEPAGDREDKRNGPE